MNFEKFWGPTIRVIVDLLNQSKFQANLLKILIEHLKETNDFIYSETNIDDPSLIDDRPDHVLHRNFLIQLLSRFVYYVETNSETFFDQFFRFVEKELLVSPFIERSSRDDLTAKKENEVAEPNDDLEVPAKEEKKNTPSKGGKRFAKKSPLPTGIIQKRKSRETFITFSRVISSFKNAQNAPQQDRLKTLILDLLCCRDSSVQKAAFNCILAYNQEQINPYVNRILRIINDKMVKTELTMFSLDVEDTDQVLPEHRAQLMPVLLRVLFGKMIGKIGKKSTGKDKAAQRKALVMRFISSCTTEEIIYFFRLLFDPIFKYIEVPYGKLEATLEDDIDLTSFVPLNKLQAMLSTLLAYMDTVANLKENSLQIVMKLINIIVFHIVNPLEKPELLKQMTDRNKELMRAIRRECTVVVTVFFQMFEYYRFKREEINFIFKHLVWTGTPGFIDKNHAQPTPLLKLIGAFANNVVYHQLLVKRNVNNSEEYLLEHIVDLYADDKTKRTTLKFIASIFADLLKPNRNLSEDSDMDDDGSEDKLLKREMLRDKDSRIPQYDKSLYNISDGVEYGQEILLAFIPKIFARLKSNCREFVDKKGASFSIESDELLIISTLSVFLRDPEQSLVGGRLLLTTLAHQKKPKLIIKTLKTIQTLMQQAQGHDPAIIPMVAEMISYQRNIEQRKEMCNLIEVLAKSDRRLSTAASIIKLMNATSQEIVDAPDIASWNEGFQLAFKYIDEMDENLFNRPDVVWDSLLLLTHQTGFIINNVDRYEFSIRDNCLVFYEKFAQKLKIVGDNQNNALNMLISKILLDKFIKKGLRDTNDLIKHTYIGILRSLAVHCHEKNKTLSEFYLFCSDNLDIDFWHNIRHIQLHNRSKALARLVSEDKIHQVSSKTLSAYFMPLAAGFLFSKAYKSVASLADNSIKLIGIICRNLNWVTYESTLSYYLGLLTKANATYQRTNIKLITEILKNFNYDISSCQEAMQSEVENKKLEKRMKKRKGLGNAPEGNEDSIDAPSGKKLSPSTARMVYFTVINKLIPRLNNCLHEMTRAEFEHDKNMSNYLPEKEEIKRIPMAYAIVQLLNLLPGKYILFRDQLPSLFLKLSSFLKSKSEQVRKTARSILIKIMCFIGPAYVPELLRTLKQNLDKGFQIHVLNYTVHSILEKITLEYGSLDHSVNELINLSFQEIFGKQSEDKEIAQILAKTSEAKKTKSYDTLMILSSYISAEKLDYLMNSIKQTVKTSSDLKTVNKLSICIQKVFTGLSKNAQFPLDKLLAFIQSTIEESIPHLRVRQKVEQAETSKLKSNDALSNAPRREDRFLISKDQPRDRVKSKINERGNFHMIVENCLRLLLHAFEQNKIIIKRKESLKTKLDGFVSLLTNCLKSSSPRCVMRSLKCIYFITQTKADLPSFKTKSNSIVKKIFILLNLYNGVGMVQGDNFEMISMCFKTLTLLLLKCEHVQLNETQVRALINYIEQDLHDTTRQATAFANLHSLLKKKCQSPEILPIMVKIADLLVTSDEDAVRSVSIKIWETYLLDYSHEGNMLQVHLTKFLRQLDYEFIDGRKSVLKILTVVVTKFPEKILRDYYELMFHLLSQRLVNEESKEVRGQVGRLIGLLIQRLPSQQAHLFNKFVIPWASEGTTELKLLGIKLISVFLESCLSLLKNDRGKIKKILSITSEALSQSTRHQQVLTKEQNEQLENGNSNEESARLTTVVDRLNYHSLRMFKRVLERGLISCVETRFLDQLKVIWQDIAAHKLSSLYPAVVITSCELYLHFLKNVDLVAALNSENPSTDNYLEWNAKPIVRTLFDRCIALLDKASESEQLMACITECMILLGQIVAQSRASLEFEIKYLDAFEGEGVLEHLLALKDLPSDGFVHEYLPYTLDEAKKRVDLYWLSVKVVMQARKEAARRYRLSENHRRNFVLSWIAAICQVLGPRRITPYLVWFMMTPVRELTDKGKIRTNDTTVKDNTALMSEDLLKFIKGLTGVEVFNKVYSRVQVHFTRLRVGRKEKKAITVVKDQVRGVKRRLDDNKRKEVKKRFVDGKRLKGQ